MIQADIENIDMLKPAPKRVPKGEKPIDINKIQSRIADLNIKITEKTAKIEIDNNILESMKAKAAAMPEEIRKSLAITRVEGKALKIKYDELLLTKWVELRDRLQNQLNEITPEVVEATT